MYRKCRTYIDRETDLRDTGNYQRGNLIAHLGSRPGWSPPATEQYFQPSG
jgi:hypothetical protein